MKVYTFERLPAGASVNPKFTEMFGVLLDQGYGVFTGDMGSQVIKKVNTDNILAYAS